MAGGLELRVEPEPDNPRKYRVIGEIDTTNYLDLVEMLQPAVREGTGDLTLDLSALAFMDSNGIRALIMLSQQLEGKGTLRLVSPGRAVARVLELVAADTFPNMSVVEDSDPGEPE